MEFNGFRRLEETDDIEKSYRDLVANASKYLIVNAMYEKKESLSFKPLNTSLNPTINDWKEYDT